MTEIAGDTRYFIGSTSDVEGLKRELEGFRASIDRVERGDGEAAIVLVTAPGHYHDDLIGRLGPNARMVESETEARKVFESAAVRPEGAPYEPPGRETDTGRLGNQSR